MQKYTTPWLAAWITAAVIFALGSCYLLWLDHGCRLDGYMTLQGKECIN